MHKSLFAAAIVLSAGAVANAGVIHSVVPVDNTAADAEVPGFSSNHYTFDLMVTVDADDDWTSISATATIDDVWFDHVMDDTGGTGNGLTDNPPNPAFFPAFPALEFDSFYAAGLWNAPGYATSPTTVGGVKDATWFDTNVNEGGTYTLARFTIIADPGLPGGTILGSLAGFSTMRNTAGDPWNYDLNFVVVPAPGSAAMLGLAGLVGLRRRR
ncbi:MAG: hypothetical protein KAS72_09195 [Phycisphaerales bacterium]|nr:hypothetical protein [Phycisphaerales bacterium]